MFNNLRTKNKSYKYPQKTFKAVECLFVLKKKVLCIVFFLLISGNVFAGTQTFDDLAFGPNEYLLAQSGDNIQLSGNFWSSSTSDLWDTQAAGLEFIGGGTHEMQLASVKSGTWDSLRLDSFTTLNVTGTGSLYLHSLFMGEDSALSLSNSLFVNYFYGPDDLSQVSVFEGGAEIVISDITGVINGGPVNVAPEPVSAGLFLLGVAALGLGKSRRKSTAHNSPSH